MSIVDISYARPLNPDKGAILMSSLFERNKNLSEKHKLIMKKVKHIAGLYDQDETENDSSVGFDYSAFMSDMGSIYWVFTANFDLGFGYVRFQNLTQILSE